jgi:hypothetical protein
MDRTGLFPIHMQSSAISRQPHDSSFKEGPEYVFLDATDKETKYGIPTAFIKEAMLSENGTYKIIKFPIVPPEKMKLKKKSN